MPTYPKGPSMAPAPMLDGDMSAEGADCDEDYMKPSEFGTFTGGFYDGNDINNNYSEPPRGERRRGNNAVATPARKTTRNVTSPGTSFRSGGTKARREPVAPPRDFDEMEFLPEPRDIRHAAKEWSRQDLSVSNDTNYSEVFHMMKSGSQQNRQVSHWATSFRESTPVKSKPVRKRRPSVGNGVGKPGWNANLGKKTGWKSLEELHATTSSSRCTQRTPRYSNARSSSVSRMQQVSSSTSMSFVKEIGPMSFQISEERDHYQTIPAAYNQPTTKPAAPAAAPPSFSSFSSSNNSFSSQSGFQPSSSQTNLRSQLTNTLSRLRASLHD
eukprot:TRINITY_DN3265_c0_g1_i1.p1 TRINITY_DN3265_c0_g1~~TRINITY_DN3265_c0_g1_i1.p1  ORF type:complete len:327 (+),score=43.84 TRINITY_DN3265_c0_g1_i1:79-1059(+)